LPDPYEIAPGVLRNKLGITDVDELGRVERAAAAQRAAALEQHPIHGKFDFAHLQAIHEHLLQDVYDWAGQLRNSDTTAMGLPHCRAAFLPQELDRVFTDIANNPLSTTDKDAAVDTAAAHWQELTLLHPFRDGNSRSQRVFVDQMLEDAGWRVDWNNVDANAAHAGRHMGIFNRPEYLAEQIGPHTQRAADIADRGLATTQGDRELHTPVEIFKEMIAHHRSGAHEPFHSPAPPAPESARDTARRTALDPLHGPNPFTSGRLTLGDSSPSQGHTRPETQAQHAPRQERGPEL
jgi:cell filamentation protein